jgi:hypothetical protein
VTTMTAGPATAGSAPPHIVDPAAVVAMPVAPRILRSIQLSLHWAGRAGLLFWRAGLLLKRLLGQ